MAERLRIYSVQFYISIFFFFWRGESCPYPWLVSGHEVARPVHHRAAVELEVWKRRVDVGDRFGHQRAKPSIAPSSQPRQILHIVAPRVTRERFSRGILCFPSNGDVVC